MKTAEAMERLRDADPIRSERLPARSEESAHASLRAILADWAAGDPIPPSTGKPARPARSRTSGRRVPTSWRWLAPTGAAVVAATIAVVVAVGGGSIDRGTSTGGPAVTVAHQAATERAVADLLKLTPVLAGATAVDHSPVAALDEAPQTPTSGNLIRRTKWWTAPGTVQSVLPAIKAKANKAGLAVSGEGSSGGRSFLILVRGDGTQSTAFRQLELIVGVAPSARGVALRADAQALWLPTRALGERVPDAVTAVDIKLVGGLSSAPSLAHHVLTGGAVHDLADVVNGLPVRPPGIRSCPADRGDRDILTFTGPGIEIVVTAQASGCRDVAVTTAGKEQPGLSGGARLDSAVTSALGLTRADDGALSVSSRSAR